MLDLETKQSGGKLLTHSLTRISRVGSVSRGNIEQQAKRDDLREVGCGYMDWIRLAQDRERWRMLVSAVMNLRVP